MAQAVTIWHSGAVSGQPFAVPGGPSLADTLNTSFQGTYAASKASRLSVVGATDITPYVFPMDSVVKARFVGLRVINGSSIKAKLTSPSGTDQAIQVTATGWFFVRAVAMVFDRHLQADRVRERFSRII